MTNKRATAARPRTASPLPDPSHRWLTALTARQSACAGDAVFKRGIRPRQEKHNMGRAVGLPAHWRQRLHVPLPSPKVPASPTSHPRGLFALLQLAARSLKSNRPFNCSVSYIFLKLPGSDGPVSGPNIFQCNLLRLNGHVKAFQGSARESLKRPEAFGVANLKLH